MDFYKKRDFGELIGDTFSFFKTYGKNYFKNYLLINGLLLILLVVIIVFGYREIFAQLFSSNIDGQNYFFETYFQENQLMLILVSLAVFFLFLVVSLINYSYPALYMKRVSENQQINIKADEILSDLKGNSKRLFFLFLGMLFIVTPLAMIIIGVSYLLVFLIIGFFLMILIMPALINVINFLLFDYLHTKKGFFDSLSYAMRAQFSYDNPNEKTPFWKYWGTTIVNYFIMQIISSIFTMIPFVIVIIMIYTVADNGTMGSGENFMESGLGILVFVLYGFAILFSFILGNIIYVSTGLMYYDSRTDLHRKMDFQEIDTIGSDEV